MASSTSASSVKSAIESHLTSSLHDLETLSSSIITSTSEGSSRFLVGLEALFLHGIKEHSFFSKINAALGLGKKRQRGEMSKVLPQSNFWLYVIIYISQSALREIERASQIRTDVGRCRAFVRVAINEGVFLNYCDAMLKDRRGTMEHYYRHAFIRDANRLKGIIDRLAVIQTMQFDLVVNSSLLNTWQSPPLALSGHIEELVQTDVGVDAVACLDDDDGLKEDEDVKAGDESEEETAVLSFPPNIQPLLTAGASNFLSRGLLNEDEALRIILQTGSPTSSTITNDNRNKSNEVAKAPVITNERGEHRVSNETTTKTQPNRSLSVSHEDDDEENVSVASSSLLDDIYRRSDSREDRSLHDEETTMTTTLSSADMVERIIETFETERASTKIETITTRDVSLAPDNNEYIDQVKEMGMKEENALDREIVTDDGTQEEAEATTTIDIFSSQSQTLNGSRTSRKKRAMSKSAKFATSPCLSGFIESWFPFGSGRYFDTAADINNEKMVVNRTTGFTLKKDVSIGSLTVAESQNLISFFDIIARERGLDEQNYLCYDCSKAIGALFGETKVCGYTKHYFCNDCHEDDQAIIPARIVFNWDFSLRNVSKKAKVFLDALFSEPIIDVKSFNSALIDFAPLLDQVITMRKKLSYIHAYLITCRQQSSRMNFEGLMESRKYLYEDVNVYAVRDFVDIKSGLLIALMNNAVRMGEQHILGCLRCTGKGFICEVCRDGQPIYPFHLESIGQCQKCYTVFHLDCSMRVRACPRCERIASRNLRWQVSESKMQRNAALMSVAS